MASHVPASAKRSPDASEDSSDATSGSNSSGNEPKRPRKSTYVARKEEAARLEQEVAVLENHVKELQERRKDHGQLIVEKALTNAFLREARREQQLSIAETQSAVSGFLNADPTNPLHTTIRLSKDWDERRSTLLNMREQKLRDTYAYAMSRSKFLDPRKPHRSEERFETENGDFCCSRFDLVQLEGVESVRQVYDALLSYMLNIEITVTEHLDQLTLREDYDTVGTGISNFRLLTTRAGVTIESNLVAFTEYFESCEFAGGAPCAVIALDFVDEDDLYPLRPSERMRKDVSKAVVLTPQMRKKTPASDEEELAVVLTQAKFLKMCRAEFDVAPRVLSGIRENMSWTGVLLATLSEKL